MPREDKLAEYYVIFLAKSALSEAIALDQVKTAPSENSTMKTATEFTCSVEWHKHKYMYNRKVDIAELSAFRSIRYEVFRG